MQLLNHECGYALCLIRKSGFTYRKVYPIYHHSADKNIISIENDHGEVFPIVSDGFEINSDKDFLEKKQGIKTVAERVREIYPLGEFKTEYQNRLILLAEAIKEDLLIDIEKYTQSTRRN